MIRSALRPLLIPHSLCLRTLNPFSIPKPPTFHRNTWLQINLPRISHNIWALRSRLRPSTKFYAVVKANAYGHGASAVANWVINNGADALAVAIMDQALSLKQQQSMKNTEILVMGWSRPQDAPLAAELGVSVTVFQLQWLLQAKKQKYPRRLRIHIKIDTGMNRLGLNSFAQLDSFIHELQSCPDFYLQGIHTHFASADDDSPEHYHHQNTLFAAYLTHLRQRHPQIRPTHIHTGNSAATMRFPGDMHSHVRCGIAIYGIYPSPTIHSLHTHQLLPALSLYSRLSHVKLLPPGSPISYSCTYRTLTHQHIATVPIGYADGYRRSLQSMHVLIKGKKREVVGRVCMDQLMVRVDGECAVGDKVVLVGEDGGERVAVQELAEKMGTIGYEVVCGFGARLPRVYVGNEGGSESKKQ